MSDENSAVEVYQPTPHQNVAGGILRTACFAIEDAARQLDHHLTELDLPREEYLERRQKIDKARLAIIDKVQGMWDLINSAI